MTVKLQCSQRLRKNGICLHRCPPPGDLYQLDTHTQTAQPCEYSEHHDAQIQVHHM